MLTMHEIEPVALCLATQQLLDSRLRSNFGDNIILRDKDKKLEPRLIRIKREINSSMTEGKYVEGHKLAVINNIDRIMALVGRYSSVNLSTVESIVKSGKELIKNTLAAESFDDIANLEADFKRQMTLPVYELFVQKSKRR